MSLFRFLTHDGSSFNDLGSSDHLDIDDARYVALGLTLLPGMLVLVPRFRRDPRWRFHAPYTVATVLVAAPAFALKGILVYLFLGSLLDWFLVTALRMIREDTRRNTKD